MVGPEYCGYDSAKQAVNQIFNDVIESDFNPDIIQIGLMDAYMQGKRDGGTAVLTVALILVGVCTCTSAINKCLKKEN